MSKIETTINIKITPNTIERAKKIRLMIFDVDGVLTDGRLFFGDDGQEYKAFHSKDGLGMKMLMNSGVEIAIITARKSELVKHRMDNLGIHRLYQGQSNKVPALLDIATEMKLSLEEIAYIGDDIIDLPVMVRVGLAIAVADSHNSLFKHAHGVTENKGGCGAAREACDMIMEAQNTLQPFIDKSIDTGSNIAN
jgi:3-deoxy-D-manno-octulosonate 8-phosphate phosphatase (KDO 8-P phosphatase)